MMPFGGAKSQMDLEHQRNNDTSVFVDLKNGDLKEKDFPSAVQKLEDRLGVLTHLSGCPISHVL